MLQFLGSKGLGSRLQHDQGHSGQRDTELDAVCIGVASMRQEEAIASSYSWVLVYSVKSSLNTAPKCSILRSNHKKNSVEPTFHAPVSNSRLMRLWHVICPFCLLLSMAMPLAVCRVLISSLNLFLDQVSEARPCVAGLRM